MKVIKKWFVFSVLSLAVAVCADPVHDIIQKGDQLCAHGKYQEALNLYQSVPVSDQKNKSLLMHLCDCLYQMGNQAYKQSRFQEARDYYEKILNLGYESGSLYYNLGNCYYRLNDTGRAVLYYERAKKRMPMDEDLKENLSMVRPSEEEENESLSDFFILRAVLYFYSLARPMQVTAMLTAYGLFILILILAVLVSSPGLRNIMRKGAWIAGIFLAVVLISSGARFLHDHRKVEAVILQNGVRALNEPNQESGVAISDLFAGTKVRLGRQSGEWILIILPRGEGWVKTSVLEKI